MKHLPKTKKRLAALYAAALFVLLAAAFLGLLFGSTRLSPTDVWRAILTGDNNSPEARIFWYVRVPRTLAALLCGAALSVSGAVIQGVLANRLASPSIIGVSSGAGLAVTLAAAFGIVGGFGLSLFAFLGAFFAVMLVSLGAKKWGASRGTVILMGVALNAFFGAISDMLTTLAPELAILKNDFRIGDFSSVTYKELGSAAVVILVSLSVLFTLTTRLEVLSLGDENAAALGMNTPLMRTLFLLLSALLAGAAVSVAGLLSYVGLLVPHAVRHIGGSNTHLLPLCALFGAALVSLCDTLSRVLFAPYELPVGILMAFLGVPFFLFLLIRKKGGHSHA